MYIVLRTTRNLLQFTPNILIAGCLISFFQNRDSLVDIASGDVCLGGAKIGFGPFGIDLDSRLEGDNSLLIIFAIQVMHTQIILFLPRILCAAGDEE